MLSHIVLVVLVVLALLVGSDRLTLGAGGVARKLGVPPFLVGLSVAAAVTSIPEIFLSVNAAAYGSTVLSINLLVGSNIANIGLVLAIACILLTNLKTSPETVIRAVLILIAVTALAIGLFLDTFLSRPDGIVLATAYLITIIYALRLERPGGPIYSRYDAIHGVNISTTACVLNAIFGISLVVLAVHTIDLGVKQYGTISGSSIGIMLLSTLTSLPELYMCILSTVRREYEFAVGLVIGSNLINISLGLGAVAIVQPNKLAPETLSLHVFVMLAFTMVLVATLLDTNPDKKWEKKQLGVAFLIAYLAYIAYTIS